MNVADESSKIYLLDLVSLGYESESDGLGSRGLVVPDPGVYNYSLPVGTVTILCVDGSVVTRRACDVKVVDRSYFYPGQLVGPTSDLSGQIGVITGVAVVLDLIEHNVCGESTKVIKGVAPCHLRRVKGLSLGDYVVSGSWLGRVVEVSIDVDVLFDDGAICKITNAESKMLRSAAKSDVHYRPEMNSLFYPGQCVTGDPRAVFKASRWLNGYWKPDRKVGIVSKVEMSGVLVYWIASAHRGTEQQFVQAFAPPAYQNPDDLTLFCSASDCTWGVADMCFFRTETDDDAASTDDDHHQKDQHYACSDLDDQHDTTDDERESPTTHAAVPTKKREEARLHRKQLRKVYFDGHRRARCLDVAEFELPMSVANTRTTVDVVWQDGTRQLGAPSTSVVPFKIVNEQEFFPGQYVVDNAFPEANVPIDDVAGHYAGSAVPTTTISTTETVAGSSKLTRRAGFVRSLNCKDQMVHVSWFKAASCPSESREIDRSDTVSAYNLGRDPDHRAYYGDVVVRLLPSGSTYGPSSPVQPSTTRASNNKNKAATAAADLSWVGRVVDLPDGHVQVKWGDGSMSTVLPHEICVIDEQNYEDLQAEMGDWVEDDGSDPPEEQAADYTENDPRNNSNIEGNGVPADGDGPAAIITGRLGSAVWSVIRLASKVLALAKWTLSALSSSEFSAARENVGAPETVPASGDDPSNGAATEIIAAIVPSDDSAKERKETADATGSGNDELFCFPPFDIRESPPDHHYLDIVDQGDSGGKRWVKIVQREWKILENNLPDTIYVRAFEDRIDLLRAVVVGASGTPYHDGLFFFDLQLPPSYPVAPPQVYYHSFGLRLNPNLYASGTVCLSLLNTFGGEGTEVWSSTTSSLLQVIVSIQGLVLNNQPYYNEAGYETLAGTAEGRRNALPYNENAYLLTLRTVLHLLHRPPLGFEEFVRDHFRRRGKFVLRACEAYLQGCDVGTLSSDGRATKRSREQPCSAGLRLALSNLVPRLETAFKEIGAEGCLKVHDPQV